MVRENPIAAQGRWRSSVELSCDVPVFIYHLGDFDPSGVIAGEKTEETFSKLAPDADITFESVKWPRMRLVSWKALVKGTLRGFTTAESP